MDKNKRFRFRSPSPNAKLPLWERPNDLSDKIYNQYHRSMEGLDAKYEKYRKEDEKNKQLEYLAHMTSLINNGKSRQKELSVQRRIERVAVQVDSNQPIDRFGTEEAETQLLKMTEENIQKAKLNHSGFRAVLRKEPHIWNQLDKISAKNAEILLSDRMLEKDRQALEAIKEKIVKEETEDIVMKEIKKTIHDDIYQLEANMKKLNDKRREGLDWIMPLSKVKAERILAARPTIEVSKAVEARKSGATMNTGVTPESKGLPLARQSEMDFNLTGVNLEVPKKGKDTPSHGGQNEPNRIPTSLETSAYWGPHGPKEGLNTGANSETAGQKRSESPSLKVSYSMPQITQKRFQRAKSEAVLEGSKSHLQSLEGAHIFDKKQAFKRLFKQQKVGISNYKVSNLEEAKKTIGANLKNQMESQLDINKHSSFSGLIHTTLGINAEKAEYPYCKKFVKLTEVRNLNSKSVLNQGPSQKLSQKGSQVWSINSANQSSKHHSVSKISNLRSFATVKRIKDSPRFPPEPVFGDMDDLDSPQVT